LKYIILLIFSLTLFLTFSTKNNSEKLTKVIVTIPNLTVDDISSHLKNEFNNFSDVDFIDGSVVSSTIVLQVDERTFNKAAIENMLNRWGLEANGYALLNTSSTSNIE